MSFPFGRPMLVLLICSLIGGGAVLCRRPARRADLTLWVFADLHARMYEQATDRQPSLLSNFQQRTGKSVQLDLITAQALDVRLLSLFMFDANRSSRDLAAPDLVEIPLESIGKYFRAPTDEVGFLPLNEYVNRSGWKERIVNARFAPWTKDGKIFGIPHDLHPCTITYRKDLFDQAGIDLESARTWSEFQSRCLRFQQYWQACGRSRHAMGLSASAADMLMVLLRQQHVELVDADLSVHLNDDKVVRTLAWYAQAVAGTNQISAPLNPAPGQSARELSTGNIASLITPDWLVADLKHYGPDLSGKLRMMPLPKFQENDASTASWGGTMIGIPRSCPDPDLAWRLIESLYLDPAALRARQAVTGILPPIPGYWADSTYHQPDTFYGGQCIDELYIELTPALPPTHVTAYTAIAQTYLSIALNQAVSAAKAGQSARIESACRVLLTNAQHRVDEMIRFDRS